MGALGVLSADAKKKRKKKRKKKSSADGCNACQDHECCASGVCVSGQANDTCGRFGDPCSNCTQQSQTCDTTAGVCTCDRAACAALQQCCNTGQCVDGTTDDNCGDDGGPCEFCISQLDEQCRTTERDRRGCCAPEGKPCGDQPIIVGNIVTGSKFVTCCLGAVCDPDTRTCVERPLCLQECSADQFCCNHASGGRLGVCMYRTGLNCPLGGENPLGDRFVGQNCPASDDVCCLHGEASTCPQTPGECPPGEAEAEPITCLD